MIKTVDFHIKELDLMQKYPKELFYIGNLDLLKRKKVAIVGSRKPNQYAKETTFKLAQMLSNAGICIVSGGAIGIDT
jgi:DNA processing protein